MKIALLFLAALPFATAAHASNKVKIHTLCLAEAAPGTLERTRLELEVIHRTGGGHLRYNVDLEGRIAGLGQITGGTAALSEEEFARLQDARSPALAAGITLFNGNGYDSVNRYTGRLIVGGSIARPETLTLELNRTGVEGEHAVAGPAHLEVSVGNCQ